MYESFIIVSVTLIVLFALYLTHRNKELFLEKFIDLEAEMRFFLESSYKIVFAEDIILYVKSGMSLDPEDGEYIAILNKLINIFKIRCGKKRYKLYAKILGGEDNLLDYISLFFTEKLYNDVTSMSKNLMEVEYDIE